MIEKPCTPESIVEILEGKKGGKVSIIESFEKKRRM